MTPQQYLDTYNGQSVLYNQKDPSLRGQCVQPVCFYVERNGFPVIWADAYIWWTRRVAQYDYIENTPAAVPQPGDIIVWGPGLPNSGGAGHLAVCLVPRPGTGTFVSVDSNWGGKYVHSVVHTYDHVVGWLRFKRPAPPTPAPAASVPIKPGDNDMSITRDEVIREYRVNRGADPSEAEIAAQLNSGTMKSLSFGFEAENSRRRAEIATNMAAMQDTINRQNQTIADFTAKLNDAGITNESKQAALDTMLADTAKQNAELTTAHDKITELQTSYDQVQASPVGRLAKLIAGLSVLLTRKPKS